MEHIAYEDEKVAYVELGSHEYAHVVLIDGDRAMITDGGELIISENGTTYSPQKWNFIYENKNPDVDLGVHKIEDGKMPELFDNVSGGDQ